MRIRSATRAPGCGRCRRTITLVPDGLPTSDLAGRTPVIAATPAPSQCPPSASIASAQTFFGIAVIAAVPVMVQPTENP